jgi:hypothetical protein
MARITCRLHLRLMSRSINKNVISPPSHQAIFEISTVVGKTPFSLRCARKLFLAALAGEDKAALSRCPRKAIAGQ